MHRTVVNVETGEVTQVELTAEEIDALYAAQAAVDPVEHVDPPAIPAE